MRKIITKLQCLLTKCDIFGEVECFGAPLGAPRM
jgi:hypothetical protein